MSVTGKSLTKCKTSHSVINILLPREHWETIQPFRTRVCAELRCGPHITVLDPFVIHEHQESAAKILEQGLKDFAPFEVQLKDYNFFTHKSSCTLFLEPKSVPDDAFSMLMKKLLSLFPQCDNQVSRSQSNTWVPHMSLGKFKNKKEMNIELTKFKTIYKPITFTVKEIYILARSGNTPFDVKYVIPLGAGSKDSSCNSSSSPYFGINAVEALDESQLARSILVGGFPKTVVKNEELIDLIQKAGFNPTRVEITLNPNGSSRGFGVVEFATRNEAQQCLQKFNYQPFLKGDSSSTKTASNNATQVAPYLVTVKPLFYVTYPDVIGRTTTFK